MRYIDPTGHGTECGFGESCVVDPYTNPILPIKTVNNTGKAKAGSSGGSNSSSSDDGGNTDNNCGYHLCSDINLYELGWQNFGQAWNIWTTPNATYGQRYLAGAYMGTWGGMHLALVAGGTVLLWKALVPGSMSCIGTACGEKIASEAGKGITVLGRWPFNKQVAEAIGGKYLNIPTTTWERLNESGRWALNQKWLDKAIARGDTFILASKWADAGTSYYFKELQYLFSKGYTISVYQNYLIPPP